MNGPAAIPQPIPYQGSKRRLAEEILRWLPVRFDRLVEPFAGSAAMTLAAAARGRAQQYWINDAHAALIALWRELIESPERLADDYEHLWDEQIGREREYFDVVRSRFNRDGRPADFLYLLARCVKAAIRYNRQGEFNNTPDNRRLGARPAEMRRRILIASELLANRTQVTSSDYKAVLQSCRPSDIVYMDPPYQGVCGRRDNRYLPAFTHDEFVAELAELNRREIRFIVSYDGRTGDKVFGERLPESLQLLHLELEAGRSTQATLLGRRDVTVESLYVSADLAESHPARVPRRAERQLALWKE
jgi:DNA adenine methylase